jgi:flagellar hook-associated protein 3 FlgL
MKVATNQYFSELTRLLTDQSAEVSRLQAKLATGEKNIRPSDDSSAAIKVLNLNSLMSQQEAQKTNLGNLDSRLVQEESIVSSMSEMLIRIQELTIMGANDTYSAEDRDIMAAEVRGYSAQMLMLANSQMADGSYLFGGAKTSSPPFVRDADNNVNYQGDATRIQLMVDGGQKLEINTTGYELFSGGSNTRNSSLDATQAFTMLDSLATALESSDRAMISSYSDKVDTLRTNVELATTKIGVRRNVIETKLGILEEEKLALTSLLSEQKDLDYTQAITELSSRMLALEAAQSTMAKISQLSLFNYLR